MPPELPQSGRKGRASGCPRPAAAVTAPARAPPPPRVQAAPPPRRVSAAAAPAPGPPGPALRPARGARGAQLTFLLRRAPRPRPPAWQRRRPLDGGRPRAAARPPRPTAPRARPYLSRQAGSRLQRPRRRRLPPGRQNPTPSASHSTGQAAGAEGWSPTAPARGVRHCDAAPGRGAAGAGSTCGRRRVCWRASGARLPSRPWRGWAAADGRERARHRTGCGAAVE